MSPWKSLVWGLLIGGGIVPVQAACSRTITAADPMPYADTSIRERRDELHHRFEEASGCVVTTLDLPAPRAWKEFAEGRLDIFWGLRSAERDALGDFAGGQSVGEWVLLVRAAAVDLPSRLIDYRQYRALHIGAVRGLAEPADIAPDIASLRASGQWDESNDYVMLMNKLAAGRTAAVLMFSAAADTLIAQRKDLRLRVLKQLQYAPLQSGAYLSRQSLNETDRQVLSHGLDAIRPATAMPQKTSANPGDHLAHGDRA